MFRWILGVLACLAIGGAALAADIPSEKIKGFTKGQTTKAQVIESLGQPVKQAPVREGGSALRYDYTTPVNAANPTPKDLIVLFVFNAADVFQGIQVYAKDDPARPAAAPTPQDAHPLSELRDENILTPVPAGFGIGFQNRAPQVSISELIPVGETVQAWSRMITQQTFYGRRSEDPSKLPAYITTGWRSACPGGASHELSKGTENGYPVVIWAFTCALNPATGKPENMWIKVISGADALYSVQYAYRRAMDDSLEPQALAYLKGVKACDTRDPAAHPCPH